MELKGGNRYLVAGIPAFGSNALDDMRTDRQDPTQDDTSSIADALRAEHQDYSSMVMKWIKWSDCYNAHDIYRYIYRHAREADDTHSNRVKRSYYLNYCSSIVDLYVAYLFSVPPVRTYSADQEAKFKEVFKDADLTGTPYTTLIEQLSTHSQTYGWVAVLVDMPTLNDQEILTEADRVENNIRPYLTVIEPQQILDWELDKFNNFEWIKFEVKRPQDRTWKEKKKVGVRNFIIWTRHDWEEWQVEDENGENKAHATIIDSGPNPIGEVPIAILQNEKQLSHAFFGLSAIRDIADINIGILNWSSLGDEEIFERCLNILTMEKSGDGGSPVTLSTHNILEYEPGAERPEFLQPGESPLKLISEWIDRAKNEIYRIAKLGGSVGQISSRQATSGIAYAFEFNETNQSLVTKAQNLAHGEHRIHYLLGKWMNFDFDGTIEYPTEFGVEDFINDLNLLVQASTALHSDTAKRTLEKKIVSKMFAKDSVALRDTINKEIDVADLTVPEVPAKPVPSDLSEIEKSEAQEDMALNKK